MSWQIFVHSVRQVFGNLNGALRVSAVLTIVQIVVTLTLGRALLVDQATLQTMMLEGNFNWATYLLSMVFLLALSLWIAVGWHRYVLTNELPALMPKLHLDRVVGYFGKSVLIGLLVLPVALFVGFLVGLIILPLFGDALMLQPMVVGVLIGVLVYIPVGVIAMRLSAALPGVALQPGVSVFTGWQATVGQTGTILGVVVLSIFGSLILALPGFYVFAPLSGPAILWQFVTQWVQVMVGVSILTTLYGHFVEGRPLV
jgi:hypothetical protein